MVYTSSNFNTSRGSAIRTLAIITLYETGFTVNEIATLFDVSSNRISQILRKRRIPGKGPYIKYEISSRPNYSSSSRNAFLRETVARYVESRIGVDGD